MTLFYRVRNSCPVKELNFDIPISPNIPSTSRGTLRTRYKEGVAGDTQPVRPGGRWGGGGPSWRKSVSERRRR